jgi:1-acyl-sn-glycerol-3-phosphate acyltransferase
VTVLRSFLTYTLTALYVLVVGGFGLLVVVPLGWKSALYKLGHGGVALALGTAGIRYKVVGRENIPRDRAVVFCANHQSNVDPPVLL